MTYTLYWTTTSGDDDELKGDDYAPLKAKFNELERTHPEVDHAVLHDGMTTLDEFDR